MTKNGLLTKAEKTALEKLLQDPDFRGKKALNHLIWMNTTKPKFRKGECFKVTDRAVSFFGVRAVNINARIEGVSVFRDCFEYRYTLVAHIVNKDGRETTSTMYANESDLVVRAKNNENRINGDGEFAESIEV